MKHAITLIVLAAAAAMTNAQTLLPAKSDIAFSARQMGVPVDGRFTRYSAQVRFHPAKVQQAAVTISIDLGGAAFGSRETEAEIAKSDWFDVTRFPQAIFRSTAVRATAPDRFDISVDLTIKGTTQQLTIPATWAGAGDEFVAAGSFQLKRLDYGIGDRQWRDVGLVANEVQVRFRLAFKGLTKD